MRFGIVILNVFACLWATATILYGRLPVAWVVVPLAISAGLLWQARTVRDAADAAAPRHIRRIVRTWSAVEGIAILLACTLLAKSGRIDAVMPAIAIIVGLHFVPLARGFPLPLYYRTAGALIAIGLAALLVPMPARIFLTGFAGAAVLWVTAVALAASIRAGAPRATS